MQVGVKGSEKRGVIYEHIHVIDDYLEISGEHIIADGGPLHLYPDFFGADEALMAFQKWNSTWH